MARLQRISGGSLAAESFRETGVPERYGLTVEQCDRAIQLVRGGRVYAGAEAVARVLMRHPLLRWPAFLYYLPGIRQAAEAAYRWVADNRFRFGGGCPEGTCDRHRH